MDFFFNLLKQSLVAMLFVVVTFAMTYVPQSPASQVPPVEAGGAASGVATEFTQIANNALLGAGNAINTITAAATKGSFLKDTVFDGIGWAIAKRIVSGMVRSLINWVNSGFQGSPSFVTDLKGFLLNIADEEIGRVISEIGGENGIGSFICSPFRLDVQISIAMQYAQSRAGGANAPACTLTGVIDNIEGFIAGIDPGNGLSDWLTITSNPGGNTPYGATLSAEVSARARLINAQGQTLTEVNWGDGFLSQKLCETVGGSGNGQDCTITKPGKIVQEALSFNLDTGRQSLVQADEINELIGALLAQLANQALTGVAGLLGLSGGTGYSYSGYDGSYLDALVDEADGNLAGNTAKDSITDALTTEVNYREVLLSHRLVFAAYANDNDNAPNDRAEALTIVNDIDDKLDVTEANILTLVDLALEYDDATTDRQVEILIEYTQLDIISESEIAGQQNNWATAIELLDADEPQPFDTGSLNALMLILDPERPFNANDPDWIELGAAIGLAVE